MSGKLLSFSYLNLRKSFSNASQTFSYELCSTTFFFYFVFYTKNRTLTLSMVLSCTSFFPDTLKNVCFNQFIKRYKTRSYLPSEFANFFFNTLDEKIAAFPSFLECFSLLFSEQFLSFSYKSLYNFLLSVDGSKISSPIKTFFFIVGNI